ncbi:MAG TPA: energy transducer TonB [Steroidobacteraceae bacterium]|nr:energy transducer TonB [Steroidobacteraceae bacterium]
MASAPSTASRSPETSSRAPGAAHSQPAVDVTAITTRDDFLLELGQALAGHAGVRPVDSLEQAMQSMAGSKRAQLLVIDTRDIADVRATVDIAHARVPRALVLVFTEANAEKSIAASLKGTSVFAVLPAEGDPRKTQAVLEGAVADAAGHKGSRAGPEPAQPVPIGSFLPQGAPQSADEEEAGVSTTKAVLIGAAMAAIAIAAGAFWYFTRGGAATHAVAPGAAAPAAPVATVPGAGSAAAPSAPDLLVQGRVDELLEKARLAMHERRYTEPSGDNALLYYRSAAAQDPHSGEALDGLHRVAGVLAGRVDEAISAGHPDEAALALANFKAASPSDPRSSSLEQRLIVAQMSKALADGNFERATSVMREAQQSSLIAPDQIARWRSDLTRRQEDSRLQHLAGLVDDRIREGKLTDDEDSARTYTQQLQSSAPTSASTQRAVRALTAAYLGKARQAAAARNSTEQDRWLNEARALGMKSTDISAFQRELTATRQRAAQADSERTLQLARTALREGRLTDPAESAAAYLSQLQSSDPTNAALPEMDRALATKLIERARAAVFAGRSGDADLTQAKRWGADPKEVLAVQQLGAPAPKRVDAASLATSLKRLRTAAPDYPSTALAQKITGFVTLEFTVSTNGEPRDVHVIEATPPGVFDQSAISAVKRWRYAPVLVNGAAVEVPVKTRVRFELPK